MNRWLDLENRAPDGAFSQYDIEVLVNEVELIPENGVYLEVGVDKGRSLWVARQTAKPSVEVYGVDLRVDPKIEGTIFTRGDSVEVSKTFNKKIDVLFIDGDHSYEGCKRDIEAWYPHMKKDGVILFHDCDETSPGVIWATAEFYYTHVGLKSYLMFKKTDKNTSVSRICL